METNRLVTIGALSERTEVNIETIRYYERIGILPKPPRSAGEDYFFPGSCFSASCGVTWSSSF
jgi:hypothetical protein